MIDIRFLKGREGKIEECQFIKKGNRSLENNSGSLQLENVDMFPKLIPTEFRVN